VITARRYLGSGPSVAVAPEDISEAYELDDGVLWVEVSNAVEADLEVLQEEFSLHPLAIEDARHHGQRPKLEMYPTHAFVVAYAIGLAEIALFVGPHWLVCVHRATGDGPDWDPAPAIAHFERTLGAQPSVGNLLHAVLDTIVDGYFDAFDATEDQLELLEDQIFGDVPASEHDVQRHLYEVRRNLVRFRRHVVPLREVMNALLRKEVPWIDDDALLLLRDVEDHVLRAIDMVDSARDLMGNAVDAHLSIISNRMNVVMKKMTSWGAILFGAGLIAGIYGMNFEHMPELRWQVGYPMALGMMATMTIVLYRVFRKKDWL
jgi:magnesium transporter